MKFFKSIRRIMITDNRASKYILYAVGEIILVVIGILIALQINNWNEDRKNNQLRSYYMRSLKQDLQRDTLEISRVARWQKEDVQKARKILERIYAKTTTIDTLKHIILNDLNVGYRVKRSYNNNTFNTIIASGNIELLDRKLSDELMQLQNLQDDEIKRSKNNLDMFNDLVTSLVRKYPPLAISDSTKTNQAIVNVWNDMDSEDLLLDEIAVALITMNIFNTTIKNQRQVFDKSVDVLNLLENLTEDNGN